MTSNTHSNTAGPTDDAPAEGTEPTEVDAVQPSPQPDDVIGADAPSSAEKDPSDWVTGDEPMTGAQRSYLDTLAREAGETLSADLTKGQASQQIDRLQEETGRGADS